MASSSSKVSRNKEEVGKEVNYSSDFCALSLEQDPTADKVLLRMQ